MSDQVDGPVGGRPRAIPEATIARLALYLRALTTMAETRDATSSDELAAAAGVNSATLRKDLSYLGSYGIRGVGYEIDLLIAEIGGALGAHQRHRVALIGVGNLGAALAGYPGFASRGLTIGALFDIDPRRIGQLAGGIPISDIADLVGICRRENITIGVIATPEPAAQAAADALVAAGVRAILAFAPGVIHVPADVDLRTVDLAVELQILAFHQSRRQPGELPGEQPPNTLVDNPVIVGSHDAAVTPSSGAPIRAFVDAGSAVSAVNSVFSVPKLPTEPSVAPVPTLRTITTITAPPAGAPLTGTAPLTVAAAPAHSPRSPR
ncbi:MAG: redox-sensing transcriptional repressor Rex [Nakamurella sp.]